MSDSLVQQIGEAREDALRRLIELLAPHLWRASREVAARPVEAVFPSDVLRNLRDRRQQITRLDGKQGEKKP